MVDTCGHPPVFLYFIDMPKKLKAPLSFPTLITSVTYSCSAKNVSFMIEVHRIIDVMCSFNTPTYVLDIIMIMTSYWYCDVMRSKFGWQRIPQKAALAGTSPWGGVRVIPHNNGNGMSPWTGNVNDDIVAIGRMQTINRALSLVIIVWCARNDVASLWQGTIMAAKEECNNYVEGDNADDRQQHRWNATNEGGMSLVLEDNGEIMTINKNNSWITGVENMVRQLMAAEVAL